MQPAKETYANLSTDIKGGGGAGGDGCGGSCPIISCVNSKNIDGCWDCNDFEKWPDVGL